MPKFGIFFLYALVACNLYGLVKSQPQDTGSDREHQPIQGSIEYLQKQLKLQITTQNTTLAILDSMQKNTQEKLDVIQREMTKNLDLLSKLESNPKGFKKIGSRYFYIEEEIKKNWIDAQSDCREKGGYLAAIQDPEEFNALISKLSKDNRYWLGINDRHHEGIYISDASGGQAPFLKWYPGDPDNRENSEHCVGVAYGSGMADWPCGFAFNFICSLDSTV
ncbi:C-type lectin 37Db-like [Drosophila takahashii]|uniref:C-type lectin 37Db-like n=1 Tax=Drosophila takahashii TaxID=29030 RepID=UPI001CF88910|nr:C-type lectin 37Db-like [Drosophila takahashii]